MAQQLLRLKESHQQELEALRLPDGLTYRFEATDGELAEAAGAVQKTTRRVVVTLELGRFEAVQTHRSNAQGQPSELPLGRFVPMGGLYGYDLISHVGCETFLHGRPLKSVAQDLPEIPFSSLHDMQQKFLFHFGHLHRQSAATQKQLFQQRGGGTWLVDATVEPDTPMYFGIYEADHQWLLEACRIPSENTDAIVPCLREAADRFGAPRRVLRDLSDAIGQACQQALPGVAVSVCNYHLVRDIGEDLYGSPQAGLRERVRQLKLQSRLKDQRKAQTQWLREHLEHPTRLAEVLVGKQVTLSDETAGREVLIAIHQWLLDYARDGRRQGFPFDPYLLYFHRRVVQAAATVEHLLATPQVAGRAPRVLTGFAKMLRQYLSDPQVAAAAAEYEAAFKLFQRLRASLWLESQGDRPLRDRYLLKPGEAASMHQSLTEFRDECRERAEEEPAAADPSPHRIVLEHLDRYWGRLFASSDDSNRERTTNALESWWGASKRRCRQRHGRKKLTREFRSLPAEFMFVGNLENPRYIELILDGDLHNLPKKLAAAGQTAGPWTHWRSIQQPLNQGRLPQRFIRQKEFLEDLTVIYSNHCQQDAA